MDRPTLFTWGYYGWGNHTPHLVEAVDAVETSRGFQPPLFVDIRIRRNVRAKGFVGTAFENELGPSRHRWMKSLLLLSQPIDVRAAALSGECAAPRIIRK